jgi:hypothetical protein
MNPVLLVNKRSSFQSFRQTTLCIPLSTLQHSAFLSRPYNTLHSSPFSSLQTASCKSQQHCCLFAKMQRNTLFFMLVVFRVALMQALWQFPCGSLRNSCHRSCSNSTVIFKSSVLKIVYNVELPIPEHSSCPEFSVEYTNLYIFILRVTPSCHSC